MPTGSTAITAIALLFLPKDNTRAGIVIRQIVGIVGDVSHDLGGLVLQNGERFLRFVDNVWCDLAPPDCHN